MRIAMVAGESNPLCKTGGLADVVFALSKELVKMGHEVMVIIPFYASIKSKSEYSFKNIATSTVFMSWRRQEGKIYETLISGVRFVLIENSFYFGRNALYGYADDGERFAYFCLAARNYLSSSKFKPDIIHCHDHQAAMMPVLIKEQSRNDVNLSKAKFVLTIHNPEFKGYLDPNALPDIYGLDEGLYSTGNLRFEGMVSTLKGGIVYAEKITTVSPNHALELLRKETSRGLSEVLKYRSHDFIGIVNGLDEEEFDPSSDTLIACQYNVDSLTRGKKACRKAILDECGLSDNGGMVIGLVSRLTSQKGIDLALRNIRKELDNGAMFLLCGTGEYELERLAEELRSAYPTQVGIYIGFSQKRAHEIYAGSDFFLMPSAFEPCGIGQLIAEKYGTLPIVRDTGGLHDTVISYDKDKEHSNGVMFFNLDDGGISYGFSLANEIYQNKTAFRRLRKNAMLTDNSWAKSASEYVNIYKSIINK